MLVKVSYVPNQEIAVHEIIEEDGPPFFEEIVRQMLSGQVHIQPTVNWIDGIAFVVSPMPATEDIIKENLVGKIHFAAVMFTRTPFQAQVTVKLNNQEFSVRLRNAERNPTLVDLVGFLKSYKRS